MRILVIGAGGIGSALARRAQQSGGGVVLAGRPSERLTASARDLGLAAITLDVTDPAAVEAAAGSARDTLGGLDAIACCVGSLLLRPAHMTTAEQFRDTVHLHAGAAFAALRAGARVLAKPAGAGGAVAFVSSAAAHIGLANHEAIAAAKGAIEGLVRAGAATYATAGLRVNAVAPGLTETPLTAGITGNPRARDASLAMHALGRLGTADEIAGALYWLLSPEAGWITGQVLVADGGLSGIKLPRG
jgi:3-oxoacyl-[acyl-carrier protein] reductase